jgi:hypothetical protein
MVFVLVVLVELAKQTNLSMRVVDVIDACYLQTLFDGLVSPLAFTK